MTVASAELYILSTLRLSLRASTPVTARNVDAVLLANLLAVLYVF